MTERIHPPVDSDKRAFLIGAGTGILTAVLGGCRENVFETTHADEMELADLIVELNEHGIETENRPEIRDSQETMTSCYINTSKIPMSDPFMQHLQKILQQEREIGFGEPDSIVSITFRTPIGNPTPSLLYVSCRTMKSSGNRGDTEVTIMLNPTQAKQWVHDVGTALRRHNYGYEKPLGGLIEQTGT